MHINELTDLYAGSRLNKTTKTPHSTCTTVSQKRVVHQHAAD